MIPGSDTALVGGGGHAKDVLSIARRMGTMQSVVGYYADWPSKDPSALPVHLGPIREALKSEYLLIPAVGYPEPRANVFASAKLRARLADAWVHPDATVDETATVCRGAVVLPGARVSPGAYIGVGAMISYNSFVGHDSIVGDLSSAMPGSMIAGDCKVGTASLLGAGCFLHEKSHVGDRARISAGVRVRGAIGDGETIR